MTIPILICDDSALARKQMARTLPKDWDVEISYATNGAEGLEVIRAGKGEIVFLDLNMPVMDGYEVLQAVQKQDLPALIIVVSGDIQIKAHERVKALGALDFIQKPVSADAISNILQEYGILTLTQGNKADETPMVKVDMRDACQEIANVAMGRAADLLAKLLDVFVLLPIPNVNVLEVSELTMALKATEQSSTVSGLCQGFIGAGIAGEALLLFHDSSFEDMAKLNVVLQGDCLVFLPYGKSVGALVRPRLGQDPVQEPARDIVLQQHWRPADVIGFGHGNGLLGQAHQPSQFQIHRGEGMLCQRHALSACDRLQRRAGKRMDRDGFLFGARLILRGEPVAEARHARIAWPPVDIDPRQRCQCPGI